MKIINAHIINFGKLHEVDFNFDENLNSFLHENGWGKTTLSVFIKSMFYGMEHTTSKDITKNEKMKYSPWQGGVYGGSLTFSHNEKKYKINRTFSMKKNEDTFELIDLKTNKKSSDFSSDLGTELFGIGRETYGRSVHVTLDESPVGSNDISAKLNNLIEADDISNFDNAISVLDKSATAIKAKRGSAGELYSIQSKIAEDRAALEDIDTRLKQNKECEKRIAIEKQSIDELQKQQDKVTEQLSDSAKYESKIRYEQLKNDLSEAEKSKEAVKNFFNGEIPSSEMISNMDTLCSKFNTVESNIKTQSATQSQKNDYEQLKAYFAGDIPSAEQISDCIKADNEYKNFKQNENSLKLTLTESNELDSLKLKYGDNAISSEIIANYIASVDEVQKMKNDLSEKKSRLAAEESQYQTQKQLKPKNIKKIVFITISIIALITGIIGFVINILAMGIAGLVFGIILLTLGIISKGKKLDLSSQEALIKMQSEEINNLTSKISETENQYKTFIAKYNPNSTSEFMALSSINNEYESYKRLSAKFNEYNTWLSNQPDPETFVNKIKLFITRYCKTDDISSVPTHIQILNDKLKKLEQLESLINSESDNDKTLAEFKEKLNSILNNYHTDKTHSFSEQVREIHDKLTTLNNCDSQIDEARKRLTVFENDPVNDLNSFENLKKPEKTVDELQDLMTELSSKVNNVNVTISSYKKTIDDNLTFTDTKEDIETEIESLGLQKQEKTKEHKILLTTIDFLNKAKENLDANYSDPMKEGFNKYVKMLGGNLNLLINTDLEVSLDCDGKLHESESLSEGYKDMVNFCSRMALVDALFKEVTPPVILDDPFVNLDDEKVPNALKLVKEISKENQVIYFACHKSREI